MKIALIHDWLTGMRGGEKVLEVLCELFPCAELFTLLHIPNAISEIIEERKIHTSFIQKLPNVEKRYRHYLPLFPRAIEQFNVDKFDIIISSSHCVAKGIKKRPKTLHICYCHTPMRYIWDMYHSYFRNNGSGIVTRMAMAAFVNYLRRWDTSSSDRVDFFIANSNHVAERIKRIYNRDAEVIYPPVDIRNFRISKAEGGYYLIVSAFAPYKRVDLAIESFNRLGLPLKIIGTGQDEKRLKKIASSNIEFLGWKSDRELVDYYANCKALIFPGEEDFGIVPVETMASGRPVIGYGKGGILETVVPLQGSWSRGQQSGENPTGIFFHKQSTESLMNAVKQFEKRQLQFDKEKIRRHAIKFDRGIFKQRIKDYIMAKYKESQEV